MSGKLYKTVKVFDSIDLGPLKYEVFALCVPNDSYIPWKADNSSDLGKYLIECGIKENKTVLIHCEW